MSARVVAVVVAWNRRDLLARTLDGLDSQERPVDAVVVIDNASTDDSAALASGHGVTTEVVSLPVHPSLTQADLERIVSAVAADRVGTAWHETWHRVEELLGDMGEHGKRVLDEVHKFASTPMMKNWLASTYNGDEGVLGQLDTPSERAAFAFQMFMHGAKMPMANKTTFERVKGWVKKLFEKLGYGTTTNDERGKNFFQYVKDGGFARDVENAASVRAGLGDRKSVV